MILKNSILLVVLKRCLRGVFLDINAELIIYMINLMINGKIHMIHLDAFVTIIMFVHYFHLKYLYGRIIK